MNKDFTGFDEMVEALEENEDMVECKECFDLVPKVDCERAEVGYICPTCKGLRTAPAQTRFVDPYDSYTQDFPEVTEYDPDSVVEYEKEPGLGDALDDLIKDEYEAIEGYEVADETIQHAAIDADQKDEILDTLDHIKEEEEEHIDELKDLCPECGDPEKEDAKENLTESAGEPKIYYIYADDGHVDDLGYMEAMSMDEVIREAEVRYGRKFHPEDLYVEEAEPESLADLVPSDFIIPPKHFKFNEALTEAETPDLPEEESEENENEEVSDLESAYDAALEVANDKGVGQVFGYATEEDESFVAIDLFDVDDAEAVEDDLRAVYDNVKYAYVAYPEKTLEEALFEGAQLNEGPGRFLKGLGQKIGNAAKHVANKDSGKLIDKFFNNGYILIFEGPKDGMPEEHKEEFDTADQALTAALHYSKEYPKYKVWVFAKPIDESELTPREKTLAKAKSGLSAMIGCFRNGTSLQKKDKEIADTLKKIEIDKQDLMKTTGKVAGEKKGDPRDSLGTDEEDEKEEEDTSDKEPKDKEEPVDEDPNLEDEEEVTDPKDAAKKMLGEKKAADGYTPESYKKYEAAYAKILAWIEAHPKPAALTQERIDNLKKQAEAKLKEVEDADPDLGDEEEEDTAALDEAKAKAKETLGEKKAADGYTKDSYATYSENYDKVVAAIENATSEEGLKKIVDQIPELNKMLEVDDTSEDDTFTVEIEETPEEEAEKESEEESDKEDAADNKLVIDDISDQALLKLYFKVTSNPTPADPAKRAALLKKIRNALRSSNLGEGFNSDLGEDELIEALQSDAEAVKSLKDTANSLKSTAASMQNMTAAMKD